MTNDGTDVKGDSLAGSKLNVDPDQISRDDDY